MSNLARTVWLGPILLASSTSIAAAGSSCGIPQLTGARDVQRFLSLRAVEIIKLAANNSGNDASHLAKLVKPTATFSVVGGDVRVPLGSGFDGARALALDMNADTYRYVGYDYMDMPADACSRTKVSVEFVASEKRALTNVEFTFEAGLLIAATGWSRSFETGSLKPVLRHH